ncbi:MAG TPA: Hsp20/alpha crystallin family protein [Kamptonema sp.]|nr:Hsp20/alpha crystallin family protein [Kamptonema sp.]
MNAFQALNDVSQNIQPSVSSSLNHCQQSTLWIGQTEESPIEAITVNETKAKLIIKVHILDIHLFKLDLQITPETILIQGQPNEAAGVEGYFRPSGFESLIPLPHPIQTETCSAEIEADGITIQLAKQLRFKESKVQIQLTMANSVDSLRMCI